jgi:hypothetical protein
MSGRLHVEPNATPLGPYTRVALGLSDEHTLRFDDVRKFGRFTFTEDPRVTLAHLGPEPLEDDFTAAWLSQALAGRQRQLKPLLLDQEFVAGLGNIYVDEALHEAKLHPLLPADRVTKAQAAKAGHRHTHDPERGHRARGLQLRHVLPHAGRSAGQLPRPVPRLRPRRARVPPLRCHRAEVRGGSAGHAHLPTLSASTPRGEPMSDETTASTVAKSATKSQSIKWVIPAARRPWGAVGDGRVRLPARHRSCAHGRHGARPARAHRVGAGARHARGAWACPPRSS